MKTMKRPKGLAVLLLTGLVATTPVLAQETQEKAPEAEAESSGPTLSAELSVDILSDYMWRGTTCNGNPVWQPSLTLGSDFGDYGGLSFNIWSSFDLTHKRGTATNSRREAGLQEIDYTLSYAVELFGLGFDVGHIWYTFPNNTGSSDQDLYLSVSYDNPIVTPSATVYWNYSDSAGTDVSMVYYSLALSHDFALTDALTLSPSASLGFGGNAWTKYVTGESLGTELTDQTIGVAASYALTDNVSLGAQINYTWIPSSTLREYDYMGQGKDQLVWGGVNVTVAF